MIAISCFVGVPGGCKHIKTGVNWMASSFMWPAVITLFNHVLLPTSSVQDCRLLFQSDLSV